MRFLFSLSLTLVCAVSACTNPLQDHTAAVPIPNDPVVPLVTAISSDPNEAFTQSTNSQLPEASAPPLTDDEWKTLQNQMRIVFTNENENVVLVEYEKQLLLPQGLWSGSFLNQNANQLLVRHSETSNRYWLSAETLTSPDVNIERYSVLDQQQLFSQYFPDVEVGEMTPAPRYIGITTPEIDRDGNGLLQTTLNLPWAASGTRLADLWYWNSADNHLSQIYKARSSVLHFSIAPNGHEFVVERLFSDDSDRKEDVEADEKSTTIIEVFSVSDHTTFDKLAQFEEHDFLKLICPELDTIPNDQVPELITTMAGWFNSGTSLIIAPIFKQWDSNSCGLSPFSLGTLFVHINLDRLAITVIQPLQEFEDFLSPVQLHDPRDSHRQKLEIRENGFNQIYLQLSEAAYVLYTFDTSFSLISQKTIEHNSGSHVSFVDWVPNHTAVLTYVEDNNSGKSANFLTSSGGEHRSYFPYSRTAITAPIVWIDDVSFIGSASVGNSGKGDGDRRTHQLFIGQFGQLIFYEVENVSVLHKRWTAARLSK